MPEVEKLRTPEQYRNEKVRRTGHWEVAEVRVQKQRLEVSKREQELDARRRAGRATARAASVLSNAEIRLHELEMLRDDRRAEVAAVVDAYNSRYDLPHDAAVMELDLPGVHYEPAPKPQSRPYHPNFSA